MLRHCTSGHARALQEAAKLIQASVPVDDDKKKAPSKLIEKEERETGVVGGHIYWAYIVASGGIMFVVLYVARPLTPNRAAALRSHHLTSLRRALLASLRTLSSFLVSEAVRVCSDLWLSIWTSPEGEWAYYPNDPPPFGDIDSFFLWMYIILGVGYCILTLVRTSTSFSWIPRARGGRHRTDSATPLRQTQS